MTHFYSTLKSFECWKNTRNWLCISLVRCVSLAGHCMTDVMTSPALAPSSSQTVGVPTVNRRNIIDEESFSRARKYFTNMFCFIASFMNPIILDAYYHELKEDIRKLTQNHDIRAMAIQRKCRKIKNQTVTFHKTELGQFTKEFLFVRLVRIWPDQQYSSTIPASF